MSGRYTPTTSLAGDTPTPGTVMSSLPTKRRATKYDWDTARANLEANPGLWVLVFEKFTSGMYTFLREGGPVVIREMGGNLQMSLRDQELIGRTKTGKLWLRWTPEDWTEQDQAAAEAAHAAGEGQL